MWDRLLERLGLVRRSVHKERMALSALAWMRVKTHMLKGPSLLIRCEVELDLGMWMCFGHAARMPEYCADEVRDRCLLEIYDLQRKHQLPKIAEPAR